MADRLNHNGKEWLALCAEFNYRCVGCGTTPLKLTKDHIVSKVNGGSNLIDNLQPLCDDCNQAKASNNVNYVAYRRRFGFGEHIPISQLEAKDNA